MTPQNSGESRVRHDRVTGSLPLVTVNVGGRHPRIPTTVSGLWTKVLGTRTVIRDGDTRDQDWSLGPRLDQESLVEQDEDYHVHLFVSGLSTTLVWS